MRTSHNLYRVHYKILPKEGEECIYLRKGTSRTMIPAHLEIQLAGVIVPDCEVRSIEQYNEKSGKWELFKTKEKGRETPAEG